MADVPPGPTALIVERLAASTWFGKVKGVVFLQDKNGDDNELGVAGVASSGATQTITMGKNGMPIDLGVTDIDESSSLPYGAATDSDAFWLPTCQVTVSCLRTRTAMELRIPKKRELRLSRS